MSVRTDCLWLYSYKEAQMPYPDEFASQADHLQGEHRQTIPQEKGHLEGAGSEAGDYTPNPGHKSGTMTERIRKWTISHRHWWIIACFFGFFRTGSLYFYNNEAPLLNTVPYIFLCLFRFVFYSLLFFSMFIAARQLLLRYASALFCPAPALSPKTGWLDYGAVFLGWLPNIIIKYPGAMCWDTWDMLFCYRTGYSLNAQHSAFYSLLLGYSVTFFERLGHADWGLWLLILGQYLLYVLAFGYSLQLT